MTAARQGGLGRGIGALIRTADEPPGHGSTRFAEVPVEQIVPNRSQPRTHFDSEALAELVTSIQEVGLLQPVVVRPAGPDRYELVMGERRLRAARAAGLERIPAIIRATEDDAMLRDALLENLHRQQLNPLEEAAAYAQLLQDFGATHEELATRLGRSRSTITNVIRLLQLPPAVQRRVAAGVLSAGHARALLALPDAQAQEQMADRVVAEGLSVRGVEEAVTLAGSEASSRRRPVRRREAPVEFEVVADRLAERFETRVRVDPVGKGRGRVIIEFADLGDLQRILTVMDAARGGAAGEHVPT